jgi:hypothetical protein
MGEELAEGPVNPGPEVPATQDNSGSDNGINPAWNDLLNPLPKEFHTNAIPILKQWDDNYKRDVEQVQSRYSPYQDFVDNEIPPETLMAALQLMNTIETDPRGFYDNMGNFYKDQWGQGQQTSDDTFDLGSDDGSNQLPDITQHPKFQELQQQLEQLTGVITSGTEQAQRDEAIKQAETELDAEEERLRQEKGDFDPQMVYALALSMQIPLENAVDMYFEKVSSNTPKSAPRILSPSGGALPSQQPQIKDMTPQERRALVARMAQQDATNSGG